MKIQGMGPGIVLVALVLGLMAPRAWSQELRIAVVDGRRALISSQAGKDAEKQLKKLVDKKKQQIEPLDKELKRAEEEFENQKYVLARTTAEERQMELAKQRRDLERRMREAQDELDLAQRKLMQPMLTRVDKVVRALGKEKGFTVILEKSSPGVLYTDDTLDITDLIIKKLNASKK